MLNYSFVSPRSAASIHRDTQHPLILINPLGEEFSQMRHSLLISALDVLQRNENVKNEAVNFFEIGNVFEMKKDILQSQMLSLASYGQGYFFHLKGNLEELFCSLGIEVSYKRSEEAVYHSGRCADVFLGEERIGSFGELSPFIALERGMKKTVFLGEFSMDKLFELRNLGILHQAPSRYPAVVRDLALLVDKNLTQQEIYDKILSMGGQLLKKVELFDIYYGSELGESKKSMAYHCVFQSSERTLKDGEVEDTMAKILRGLEEIGAQRR
jgi:phenylalanyl-tRNA synthetase beta chain